MISLIVDKRNREPKHKTGGVGAPTYGVKVNNKIRQLLKLSRIRMIVLRDVDYCNIEWLANDLKSSSVAVAFPAEDNILLNATELTKYKQSSFDLICLHEIAHILLQSTDEEQTDTTAIAMAQQLGIKVPQERQDDGLVVLETKRGKKQHGDR